MKNEDRWKCVRQEYQNSRPIIMINVKKNTEKGYKDVELKNPVWLWEIEKFRSDEKTVRIHVFSL